MTMSGHGPTSPGRMSNKRPNDGRRRCEALYTKSCGCWKKRRRNSCLKLVAVNKARRVSHCKRSMLLIKYSTLVLLNLSLAWLDCIPVDQFTDSWRHQRGNQFTLSRVVLSEYHLMCADNSSLLNPQLFMRWQTFLYILDTRAMAKRASDTSW